MLTQNKNGPCPLLALVNALILGATEDMQAALDDALRLREQVSLGLIIETLMDELLSRAAMVEGLQLPDVDELNRFLSNNGYVRAQTVREPGEYAVRGGIIDLFPPGAAEQISEHHI